LGQPLRLPGVIFFCISDTLVPTTYLVDTTLSYASDYDQTVHAVRLRRGKLLCIFSTNRCAAVSVPGFIMLVKVNNWRHQVI
ncbi:hypothetical protein, partial [Klebsiella pneumoniae]|uniref:hypothetical protein n=1 Tax=Klebsiella pneumoniae TaxID=573 RepID=UPI001C6FC6CA